MTDLRVWKLQADDPYAAQIAADARLSSTAPALDHVWEAVVGTGESAALALQTRFGGRAGLVSLVPMWNLDGAVVYQAAQLAAPVTLRGFAPAFIQFQSKLTAQIALLSEFWAIDSHTVGGRFLLRSLSKQPIKLRLDLLAFVGIDGREQTPRIIPIPGERHALALGVIGDLLPIVMLENGYAPPEGGIKLSADISLAVGARAAVRFTCSALPDVRESLGAARRAVTTDWGKAFKRLSVAANDAPRIETGDTALDATIAAGYQQLTQAFISAPALLPHLTFATQRQPATQHNPLALKAQDPALAYLLALAAAPVDVALAQGIVRNYLATQRDDGWIDGTLAIGDRPTYLCLPILARMTWSVFQYSEDADFLREAFPKLLKFYDRWQHADHDADGDGAPEWQSAAQMGYSSYLLKNYMDDPRLIETPALVAYLLSEAISLREIAFYLRNEAAEAEMKAQVERLRGVLETFWQDNLARYQNRDRDTHRDSHHTTLLNDGAGDEDHFLTHRFDAPNRVIVEVVGGWQHTPKLTLTLEGLDADGNAARETIDHTAVRWQTGRGRVTSQTVFSQLDRVKADDLVRVYRLNVSTPNFALDDLDDWLPLWSVGIPAERAAALVRRYPPIGLAQSMYVSIESWWMTIIGEGLIEYAYANEAVGVLRNALEMTERGLREQHAFTELQLNMDDHSAGQRGHVAGLPPLHLLLRVLGVRVISATKVWTGGAFAWGAPVKVTHKGVVVERSADDTRVTFPSGNVVELAADAAWQEVVDGGTGV
jgi:hypothetical protein